MPTAGEMAQMRSPLVWFLSTDRNHFFKACSYGSFPTELVLLTWTAVLLGPVYLYDGGISVLYDFIISLRGVEGGEDVIEVMEMPLRIRLFASILLFPRITRQRRSFRAGPHRRCFVVVSSPSSFQQWRLVGISPCISPFLWSMVRPSESVV